MCPFWVSPDGTKIVYVNLAIENNEEEWNLYSARINGNILTGKTCIYKNYGSDSSSLRNIQWSPDSKKVLFFKFSDEYIKNQYPFFNKNEVNVFTFK
ncbi:hypothetical protein IAI10_04690 [Clostridium sp. 19966]|uniref:hypothetical protein n=1 Tax=Clostridium sp. 19966 TaxID=2768166 RepID=UPI0028E078CA|nr:hypothetical protein [Clostridium sp. 19966]MDT8715942.1 hypothetical protein [Clostridium sp. 19966]